MCIYIYIERERDVYTHTYVNMYIYIYIYMHTCTYILYIYIYIYMSYVVGGVLARSHLYFVIALYAIHLINHYMFIARYMYRYIPYFSTKNSLLGSNLQRVLFF